jgi:aspartyl-tRNA(Asn)/glutamyl-tRNA(Gln) amidotransferase subunit A
MLAIGTLTSRQLLDHCLDRIARINPAVNAIVTLSPDAAAEADAADLRRVAGRRLGPLDGMPIAIKDNLLVRGVRTVWGSKLFEHFVPDHDELPVALLRAAGAVLIGKTNVPEFTLRGFTANPVFGVTRNPWNLDRTPGGSSGGAAAAVAAGLVPLALGTDGGGSIRRPAAYTGLVGLKPTIARIPRARGFPQILHDCEVVGPIARTVNDARLMLSVLAQPHVADQRSRLFQPLQPAATPSRLRILYVESIGDAPVDLSIRQASRQFAERLTALGHSVITGMLPFSIDAVNANWGKIGNVGLAMLARTQVRLAELASPAFAEQARLGGAISGAEYLELLELLFAFRSEVGRAFASIDVIMTPAAAAQPWAAEQLFPPVIEGRGAGPRGHAVFTGWVNACGHPALAIPAGHDDDDIPIGVQLVGDYGTEAMLLDLGRQVERAYPWADQWPALAA